MPWAYKVKCNSFSYHGWQLNQFSLRKGFLNSAPWHLGPDKSHCGRCAMHCGMPRTPLASITWMPVAPSQLWKPKMSPDICIDPPGDKAVPVENCGSRTSLVPLQNSIPLLVPSTVPFPVTKFQIHLLFCSLLSWTHLCSIHPAWYHFQNRSQNSKCVVLINSNTLLFVTRYL